jgi:hypothetical protein
VIGVKQVTQMSVKVVRRLQFSRPTRRPGLYLLEIAAALLSVLTLRGAILHDALPPIETLFAAVLWIAFFVAAHCLTRNRVS